MTEKLLSSKNDFRNSHQIIEEKYMTICIGAICDVITREPKIILCSDSMLSLDWVNFEGGQTKIFKFHDYCNILTSSNDITKSDLIFKDVSSRITDRILSIEEIAEQFSQACKGLLRKFMERDILSKYGLDYKTFIDKSKDLSTELIRTIEDEIKNYKYEFESQFIVAGFDVETSEPHLYIVNQLGDYSPHDFIGFAIIGSGYPLAFAEMTKHHHKPQDDLNQTLVRVWKAKRDAERASGVGERTSLLIMKATEDKLVNKKFIVEQLSKDAKKILNDCVSKITANEKQAEQDSVNQLYKIPNMTIIVDKGSLALDMS